MWQSICLIRRHWKTPNIVLEAVLKRILPLGPVRVECLLKHCVEEHHGVARSSAFPIDTQSHLLEFRESGIGCWGKYTVHEVGISLPVVNVACLEDDGR